MKHSIKYFFATLFTLFLGYESRQYYPTNGTFIHDYVGDAIWAAMIYFGFRMMMPQTIYRKSIIYAMIFCFSIEFLQLYHAPWIEAIRHTQLGGLILGFEFLWSDLVSYIIGILVAFIIDNQLIIKQIP
ncbi:MAG: hypothetical protein RLZZ628_1522 [Bacteroidota bacterium]|jgi:hypothetical protein